MFKLLVVCLSIEICIAFPSYRWNVPNGYRIPCPPGAEGCSSGELVKNEPESVCYGVGHRTCKGGTLPFNPFGEALQAAGHQWTKELCEADSDGDGLTNGEELGDPCCLWEKSDPPALYTQAFEASHPGMKDSADRVAGYERPSCVATYPNAKGVKLNAFNEGEEQRHMDFVIDNYTIPSSRTTYVDFVFNIPDESHGLFHAVYGEAIIDKPRNLHHYVVKTCSKKFPPELNGKAVKKSVTQKYGCEDQWGGWAPGGDILNTVPWAGVPFGKDVGIVSFSIAVHYDNQPEESGIVSQDGMRIYYTPTLRPDYISGITVMMLSYNPGGMKIPPGVKRSFLTRSCELTVETKWGEPAVSHLFGMGYHAHLLGREMYTELTFKNGTTIDLGSRNIWHFDDQATENLLIRNLTVQTGDFLQSTCVFDSTGRTEDTKIGFETTDEMCWAAFKTWPGSTQGSCKGLMWWGELDDHESGLGLAKRHPACKAVPYGAEDLMTGGQAVKAPECEADEPTMTPDAEATMAPPDVSTTTAAAEPTIARGDAATTTKAQASLLLLWLPLVAAWRVNA